MGGYLHRYGVFSQDGAGPLFQDSLADREEAKLQAQNLADKEDCEYFVFDLYRFIEVARVSPPSAIRLRV